MCCPSVLYIISSGTFSSLILLRILLPQNNLTSEYSSSDYSQLRILLPSIHILLPFFNFIPIPSAASRHIQISLLPALLGQIILRIQYGKGEKFSSPFSSAQLNPAIHFRDVATRKAFKSITVVAKYGKFKMAKPSSKPPPPLFFVFALNRLGHVLSSLNSNLNHKKLISERTVKSIGPGVKVLQI